MLYSDWDLNERQENVLDDFYMQNLKSYVCFYEFLLNFDLFLRDELRLMTFKCLASTYSDSTDLYICRSFKSFNYIYIFLASLIQHFQIAIWIIPIEINDKLNPHYARILSLSLSLFNYSSTYLLLNQHFVFISVRTVWWWSSSLSSSSSTSC